VLFAFHSTIDRIAGRTDLQVTAGETGFDEQALETAQATPGVRVAVPVIEAVVETGIADVGQLLVLGVDMTGDRSLRDYDFQDDEGVIDDPLVFLAQPDSIVVTREFAERTKLAVNSRVVLGTTLGPRPFTVRGIMKSSGLSSAFGGNLAIMDVYAAQLMFGRGRTFDRVDVGITSDTTVDRARDELRARLGPRSDDRGVLDDGEHFERARTVHRHVHHLQLVCHRRDAAAGGDWHPARSGRCAFPGPDAVSR
jgi:putative ABC transport system permease protein